MIACLPETNDSDNTHVLSSMRPNVPPSMPKALRRAWPSALACGLVTSSVRFMVVRGQYYNGFSGAPVLGCSGSKSRKKAAGRRFVVRVLVVDGAACELPLFIDGR